MSPVPIRDPLWSARETMRAFVGDPDTVADLDPAVCESFDTVPRDRWETIFTIEDRD